MTGSPFAFVDVVVADLDLVVSSAHEHACRLEPRQSELAWHCDLDDGTPTGESDPASFVRWVCPGLRPGGPAAEAGGPVIDVRRPGSHSDLAQLVKGLGRLLGRPSADEEDEGTFVYTDPAGILDADLRRRIESWPSAPHDDGVERPAELWSIRLTGEGLVVESVSWWDSAPALAHQIRLGVDLARHMTALE